MHRAIDINLVTKIEYAEFPTEADMNLYEIYFINKLKPPFNVDDKTPDELTVVLPDIRFIPFSCNLWDSWKRQINDKSDEFSLKHDRYMSIPQEQRILRSKFKMGDITEEQYYEQHESLKNEYKSLEKYLFG